MEILRLGIRHHGIGSAKNVWQMLHDFMPDIILVEGPPEGEEILKYTSDPDMKPPVALLVYQQDHTEKAAFYPFAAYSPEWQAIRFANLHRLPLRFMDLPLAHKFALTDEMNVLSTSNNAEKMNSLAQCAGYENFNDWWEDNIEKHDDAKHAKAIFDLIEEAINALREGQLIPEDEEEALRESFMRNYIRKAIQEKYEKIAIICGAWHLPALDPDFNKKEDKLITSKLQKVKIAVTWVPWTNNRLSLKSGYGAGILHPGWYGYKWSHPQDKGTRWMIDAANLLRTQSKIPIAASHVMEAIRLAHSLAELRGLPNLELSEMSDAMLTTMCNGDERLLQMIHEQLVIGNEIGTIPPSSPKVLLLVDFEDQIKKLRLKPQQEEKLLSLDLRNENELVKSAFLHRINLLGVAWAKRLPVRSKGTFREEWKLVWQPEVIVAIIEKAYWGNTIRDAAISFSMGRMKQETNFSKLAQALEESILADLPNLTAFILQIINDLAADITHIETIVEAVPPLVFIVKYGNVRNTDRQLIFRLSYTLIARVCVNILSICHNIDDEQSSEIQKKISDFHHAILLLDHTDTLELWHKALVQIVQSNGTHSFIAGYTTQLVCQEKLIALETTENIIHQSLSIRYNAANTARWIEGFVKDGALSLLFNQMIWQGIDNWLLQLNEADFVEVLPLLRRAFSNFQSNEKNKIAQKIAESQEKNIENSPKPNAYSPELATQLLNPFLKKILFNIDTPNYE